MSESPLSRIISDKPLKAGDVRAAIRELAERLSALEAPARRPGPGRRRPADG